VAQIHVLLFGEGAGTYLPFARARLHALSAIDPDGYFSQTFKVDDATINVRHEGRIHYIKITIDGGFYFEFATSGKPRVNLPQQQSGIFFSYYHPLIIATNVTVSNGSIVTKPFVRNNERGQHSAVGLITQAQLINSTIRHVQESKQLRIKYKYPETVYSSFAAGHSYTGIGLRTAGYRIFYFSFMNNVGAHAAHIARDIAYDQTYGYSIRINPMQIAYVFDQADWPRESGRQVVESEQYGSRAFGIIIDAFGKFHIYPTASITALTSFSQNIVADHIRHLQPDLPAWCFAPALFAKDYTAGDPVLEHWLIDQPDIDWKFDHLGTYACAIFYGRSPFDNDPAYWAVNANTDQPWTPAKFDVLKSVLGDNSVEDISGNRSDSGYNTQRYFVGAGIIEVRIVITITGAEVNQYTAELQVHEVRDPNTATYAAMLVGYSHIDSTAKNVAAGDMICVDIEHYSLPNNQAALERRQILSMKNLTKNEEIFTCLACPVLAVDLSMMALALRLENRQLFVKTMTPLRTGPAEAIDWAIDQFAVWIIHTAASKGIIYPNTMVQAERDLLYDLTLVNGRLYMDAESFANPLYELVPLAHPGDGWATSEYVDFREYWGYDSHYWYNEPWVIFDPDYTFYGSAYPTQGYVKYKIPPGPYTYTGDFATTPYRVLAMVDTRNQGADHLMLCDNPRWGWHCYAGIAQEFNHCAVSTTFYAHPNGSYAFWCDSLIYNAQGVPNGATISSTSIKALRSNALSIFDVTKLEHCIFDRVHLEVKKEVGTAATLDTTFLDLYNRAVQKGLDDQTLEAGIETMQKSDMQGVFEKVNAQYTDIIGYVWEIIDLKFTWNGKEWYMPDPAMRGEYIPIGEPVTVFGPQAGGRLVGLNLMMYWHEQPYDQVGGNTLTSPSFVDLTNFNAAQFRFANPIIIAT
jgi:hypothetical protein